MQNIQVGLTRIIFQVKGVQVQVIWVKCSPKICPKVLSLNSIGEWLVRCIHWMEFCWNIGINQIKIFVCDKGSYYLNLLHAGPKECWKNKDSVESPKYHHKGKKIKINNENTYLYKQRNQFFLSKQKQKKIYVFFLFTLFLIWLILNQKPSGNDQD